MNASTYIDQARHMAAFLEDRETHMAGDRDVARARLRARYGISESLFHALRYRPPKQIAVDVFNRLCAAVEDTATKQIGTLQHEIQTARAASVRPRENVVRAAEAVLAEVKAIMENSINVDR